jgi:perosamine synthetase
MTTGHGGMILTDSKEFCYKLRIARGDDTYEYTDSIIPLNFKMTDFQAALGINQLKRLDGFVKKRREIAKSYTRGLNEIDDIILPKEDKSVIHCYYKYVIQLKRYNKELFIENMRKKGIQVGRLYEPPLHKMKIVKELFGVDVSLPISEMVSYITVSLPMYTTMINSEIDQVVNSVKEVTKT